MCILLIRSTSSSRSPAPPLLVPEMEGIRVGIHDISSQLDSNGSEFMIYHIDVTVASPFHGWNILRRYTDFVNLFQYMTTKSTPRRLPYTIPSSTSTSSQLLSLLSPKSLAMKRKQRLQDYLTALLAIPDLTSQEIHILKVFLDFEQYEIFLDQQRNRSLKMVTSSDIERSLLNIENITQVSRVLFLDKDVIGQEEQQQQQQQQQQRQQGQEQQKDGQENSCSLGEEQHDLCQLLLQSNSSTISSNIEIDRLCSLPSPPPPDTSKGSTPEEGNEMEGGDECDPSAHVGVKSSSISSSPERHHRHRSGTYCSEELDPEQSAIWRTVPDELTETESPPQTPSEKPKRESRDFTPQQNAEYISPSLSPQPSSASPSKTEPSRHLLSASTSSPSLSTHTPPTITTRSISLCSSSGFTYPPTSDGLKEAIRNNDLKIIKQILQTNPALASFCDSQGHPLIYTCALYNNIPIALLLIDYSADPYTVNLNGLSALDIATPQWKTIILERFIQKINLLERKSLFQNSTVQYLKGNIKKTSTGIGLKLGKNPNGRAIILGFSSPVKRRLSGNSPTAQETQESLEDTPKEFLRVCDIIHLIDGKEMKDLSEVIRKIKETEVNDLLEITVLRSDEGGYGSGSRSGE